MGFSFNSDLGGTTMICSQASHCIITNIGCFIYNFQTLLTGATAILVAIVAGIPVWKQLKDTNLQTRISHRETLASLMRDAITRYSKVEKAMRDPLLIASRMTSDPVGEPIDIDPEDAHQLEQMFASVLDWYLIMLADTEHCDIETRKAELKTVIDKLVETLGDAHWADHNEQSDEDHDFPDEEWAAILARCASAKHEASDRVGNVSKAYRELVNAQQEWVQLLRSRIANLDLQIVDPH